MLNERTHDLTPRDGPVRVGVLSDTHGEISQHVLAVLEGSDIIVHAGDVCGQHVLVELSAITPDVFAVNGNNDPYFDYSEFDKEGLADLVNVQLPGGNISVLHGHQFGMHTPSHASMRQAFASSRAVVYGHSHRQIHDKDGTPQMLNPGAAGSTRTNGGASCAIVIAHARGDWEVSLYRDA